MLELNTSTFDNIVWNMETMCESARPLNVQNKMAIRGTLEEDFSYSHCCYNKAFYQNTLKVFRMSGVADYIPIIMSHDCLPWLNLKGERVETLGEIRTKNLPDEYGKSHVNVYFFVKQITPFSTKKDVNLVYLEGAICKTPIYRVTPRGLSITELLLAVNYGHKSAYVPCITWNTTAGQAKTLCVGDKIAIYGRFQSRRYFKLISEELNEGEYRTTYEVSVMKMMKL